MVKKTKKSQKTKKPARKSTVSDKITRKKPLKAQNKKIAPRLPNKIFAGKVTHYFTNIGVGVIELSKAIKTNDRISVEGATTNFKQKVDSMQIHGKPVQAATKGQSIGIKVSNRVRSGDKIYLIN